MIPVLLLNQQKLVRECWASFLSAQPGIVLVGQTPDPYEAAELTLRHQPKIVLASDELIVALQFRELAAIHDNCPTVGVVLVMSRFSEGLQSVLGRLGVRACLSRHSSLNEILTAIVKVNSGKTYASAALLEGSMLPHDSAGYDALFELTARELEITSMLVQGKTSKEVAAVLHISFKTVEVHRHNILTKMHCKNTTMLINRLSAGNPLSPPIPRLF